MYTLVLLFALSVITLAKGDFTEAAKVFFDIVDTDDNGGVVREESVAFFHTLDCNHDCFVNYPEFLTSVEGKPVFDGYEAKLYSLLDYDQSKLLTLDDWENDFLYFDTNKDDVVTEEEWLAPIQQAQAS